LRIKRLELFGFKSFKDKTVIHFDKGITGIVGPNGCGKSNIVDALVWVMGEQSAKHLRGASMEDVIFNGSENFAPLGMAEVNLTLENDGGPFPARWMKMSEITITRRLHRSGESEYFINKEPSRLRDIVEVFMDTGAGSKGFSIIEQGQIGKIITAKPEDRRVLIEEAAGITKFKVRKRESQRKLESTEANLVRLNDIIGELRRQLDSLQRQAKRAERYRELKTTIQNLDLWISSVKYKSLKEEASATLANLDTLKLQETESQVQYEKIVAELQTLKLDLLEREKHVMQKQAGHYELQSQTQKKENELRLLQMEIDQTKRSEEMAGTLRAEVTARRDILRRDLDQVQVQLESVHTELSGVEGDAEEKKQIAEENQGRARDLDDELTRTRRELMAAIQGSTQVEVRAQNLQIQVQDYTERVLQSEAVKMELQEKRVEFEASRNKAFNALENQRQMQLSIMKDVESIEYNLNAARAEESERRQQLESFRQELNEVASRLYGLESINTNFEGLQEGVRNVMLWSRERQQARPEGGFELVADVVEVSKDYEVAMEAALGEKLQGILASSSNDSVEAVGSLKEKKAGRSSFLSDDLINIGSSEMAAQVQTAQEIRSADTGVRGMLSELIRVPEKHQNAIAHILDGVVVVDDVRTALRLRSQFPGYTFVSVDGDVLSSQGVLTGGSSESADSGVLRKKREIKELSIRKEEMAGKVALASAALEKIDGQARTLGRDLENANKQSFEQEIQIMERKKDLERAESEFANVEMAIQKQQRDIDGLRQQLIGMNEQLALAESSLGKLREKRSSLENKAQELESEANSLKVSLDELQRKATEAMVLMATKRQTVESLAQQQSMMERQLGDAEVQLSRMAEDSEKNTQILTSSEMALQGGKTEFERFIQMTTEAERAVAQARDQYEILSAQVRELDEKASLALTSKNQASLAINEAQLKASQAQLNEKYLVDQILERYQVNLVDVAAENTNREGDLKQAALDFEEAREKIKKIGEVNLTAIQEYEELSGRYEFLTKQQQDLNDAMESLRKVIDRINRICARRFRETFEMVNERFKQVFPVLFGGGEAYLTLIETEESNEPGVEIIARPPGKKLQSVTLLSGGEKALTAVSLIFAIFLIKPSPFCLLDEVDAPLDDANVFRFNELVREMAKRSQVILVTHNKHTMEINDTLYGVTMEDRGVSKMVAVRLNA